MTTFRLSLFASIIGAAFLLIGCNTREVQVGAHSPDGIEVVITKEGIVDEKHRLWVEITNHTDSTVYLPPFELSETGNRGQQFLMDMVTYNLFKLYHNGEEATFTFCIIADNVRNHRWLPDSVQTTIDHSNMAHRAGDATTRGHAIDAGQTQELALDFMFTGNIKHIPHSFAIKIPFFEDEHRNALDGVIVLRNLSEEQYEEILEAEIIVNFNKLIQLFRESRAREAADQQAEEQDDE